MSLHRIVAPTVATILLFAGTAFGADEHHPPATTAQAPPPAAPAPQRQQPMQPGGMGMGPGGGAMGGMMGQPGMMPMTGMMGPSGGMMGRGMGPMMMQDHDMTQHVEGRIAFLRAELKITQVQAGQWNDFAEALRNNAKTLANARPQPTQDGASPPTLSQRLDQQERFLQARLAGLSGIKAAFEHLYTTLSAEQKKVADELVPPHVGLMRMGMM